MIINNTVFWMIIPTKAVQAEIITGNNKTFCNFHLHVCLAEIYLILQ